MARRGQVCSGVGACVHPVARNVFSGDCHPTPLSYLRDVHGAATVQFSVLGEDQAPPKSKMGVEVCLSADARRLINKHEDRR